MIDDMYTMRMRARLYTHTGVPLLTVMSFETCLFIITNYYLLIYYLIIIYLYLIYMYIYVHNIAFLLKMLCPQSILMEDLSLALACNIVS
jgi:hypothetical protein